MAEEYIEGETYTLTDEEGNENEFELLGSYEKDGRVYLALIPTSEDEEEYVILRRELDENGEVMLETVDDDDEFDAVADYFEDTLFNEVDYDEENTDSPS